MDNIQKHFANNLIYLRKQKGFSQEKLAHSADMPRSTLTHMESGNANPSLTNLAKIATALQVSVEELIAKPRKDCRLVRAKDIPVHSRKMGGAKLLKLLPEKIRGIEIDRLCLEPKQYMQGSPHIVGTKEYFYCIEGCVEITVLGDQYLLEAGDVLAFPGDVKHFYQNKVNEFSSGFSVVVPTPAWK